MYTLTLVETYRLYMLHEDCVVKPEYNKLRLSVYSNVINKHN